MWVERNVRAIAIGWIVLMLAISMTCAISAKADGLHLGDMKGEFGSVVVEPVWVSDVGAIFCTKGDFEIKCWKINKVTKLDHSEIHVWSITEKQASSLIILEAIKNEHP